MMANSSALDKAIAKRQEAFEREAANLKAEVSRLAQLQKNVGKVVTLKLDEIVIEENVRRIIDTTTPEFGELVDSIRNYGIMQNIVAELQVTQDNYRIICIAGQRRLLAARAAQVEKGPVLLREYKTDDQRVVDGLTENLLREELHCLDVAEGYLRLFNVGWSEEMIMKQFERGKRTVRKYLILARYPAEVKEIIRTHPDAFSTRDLMNEFASRQFKTAEDLIAAVKRRVDTHKARKKGERAKVADDINLAFFRQAVEQELKESCNLRAKVKGTSKRGWVALSYRSAEELQQLISRLKQHKQLG
jgi:ParB family transcriptional regulator, chromosome partitioning protein